MDNINNLNVECYTCGSRIQWSKGYMTQHSHMDGFDNPIYCKKCYDQLNEKRKKWYYGCGFEITIVIIILIIAIAFFLDYIL